MNRVDSFPTDAGGERSRERLPTARRHDRIRRPPGFAKGAAVGILALIPAVAATVWAAGSLADFGARPSMIEALRLTALFAGLPAVVTAGGVGRLAGQASLDGGRPRAMWVAARALAFAGGALMVIAAIANQVVPWTPAGWLALIGAGAVAGALAGLGVGLACGGPMPSLSELGVWPGEVDLTAAVERVVHKAIGRRRDGEPPPTTPER